MIINVDEILDAVDIGDIIGDFVNLKKSGSNFIGLCPFHDEKTPSFIVSPSRNIYKCFGCGAGGNAVRFLMDYDKLEYPEALRYIAKKYNIQIKVQKLEKEDQEKRDRDLRDRQSLQIIYQEASNYYMSNLGGPAKDYIKSRFKNLSIVEDFSLGFAPDSWTGLFEYMIKKQFNEDLLKKSGLFIQRKDGEGWIDYFRGRLMFPIFDPWGSVVGFGGRLLVESNGAPKYLNSPETLIYNKSRLLYNLHIAKREIAREDLCNIVEGYTDAIQLYKIGVRNVVSGSGTALSPDQAKIIKKYTKNIRLIYDGDEAGRSAIVRNGETLLKEGLKVQVLPLPEGKDPGDFFNK